MLGCAAGTVKSQAHHGLATLRRRLTATTLPRFPGQAMNDRLEDRLIDTLEQRAGEVTDASDMADRAVAVGRRAQRRHRILVVAVTASLVAAISIASAQMAQRSATGPGPSGPATSPTTPAKDKDLPNGQPTVVPTPAATETGTDQPQARRVARCRDIPTDEPPQNHGTDTTPTETDFRP
jgi:hypothetical protein